MKRRFGVHVFLALLVLFTLSCSAGGGGGGTTTSSGTDKTPPVITSYQPTSATILAANIPTVNMVVTTNENATCRYSDNQGSDAVYASLPNTFGSSLSTSHSVAISLTNGGSYSYYVRCQDASQNASTAGTQLTWSVATVNNSNATLSWTPSVQGPTDGPTDGYAIFSCTTTAASCSDFGSAPTATVTGSTSSTITLSSLPTGTNCFGVKAYNTAYYSVNYANCTSTNNCCKRIQ